MTSVRLAPRRLPRRNGRDRRRNNRSRCHLAALQSRHRLQPLLRSAGSRRLSRLVPSMGGAGPANPETCGLVFSQSRRLAFESVAAARTHSAVARSVRPSKHDPLDQGDHDRKRGGRACFSRTLQADQFAAVSQRLPRIHFSSSRRTEKRRSIVSRSAFRTRTRAISRAGATRAEATGAAAATPGSFPYKTISRREKDRPHPATFPVELAANCIRLHGLRDDLVMVDPFLGIGNSAIAARECGVAKFHRV